MVWQAVLLDTHLERPLEIKILLGRRRVRRVPLPVALQLYLGLQYGLLAHRRGKELVETGLELLGGQRARRAEYVVQKFVEQHIDGAQRLQLELDGSHVGQDIVRVVGRDVGRT